jgi:hypothetical protein
VRKLTALEMIDGAYWLSTESAEAIQTYNYQLRDYLIGQGDIDPQTFVAEVKYSVIKGACNQLVMRDDFLKRGVTVRYSYYDRNKRHIANVDVTPSDCGFVSAKK